MVTPAQVLGLLDRVERVWERLESTRRELTELVERTRELAELVPSAQRICECGAGLGAAVMDHARYCSVRTPPVR